MRIILLGSPGAGKGSQADLLKDYLKVPHVSTGSIFRKLLSEESPLATELKKYVLKGLLVPDELTNVIVAERLIEKDLSGGFILDGYPRNVDQAKYLDEYLKSKKLPLDLILNISASDEIVLGRLSGRLECPKCGKIYHKINSKPKKDGICDNCKSPLHTRKDDELETIKNRLVVYHQETEPVLDYYKNHPKYHEVDGSITVNDTFIKVKGLIGEKCL